jgi:hypothetical protein
MKQQNDVIYKLKSQAIRRMVKLVQAKHLVAA